MKGFMKGFLTAFLILLPVTVIVIAGILFAAGRLSLPGSKTPSDSEYITDEDSLSSDLEDPVVGENTQQNSEVTADDQTVISVGMGDHEDYSEKVDKYYDDQSAASHEPVTISFAGDILIDDGPAGLYDKGGISALFSEELLSDMQESSIFMVNEEFPFSTRGEQEEDKQYTFRVNPRYVSVFTDIGTDIATLANNHALDYGTDALLDSVDTLDNAGILHVGAGSNLAQAKEPVIVEAGGYKIGFIGATRVIPQGDWAATSSHAGLYSAYDVSPVVSQIKDLKQSCDYVAVYFHWGIEKNTTPEDYERQMAYQCIDAGADIVLGSHPHVLQGFEYYKNKPIAYSLGNYLFSNRYHNTILYQIIIDENGEITAQFKPLIRTKDGQVRYSSDPASAIDELQSLSYSVNIEYDGAQTGIIRAAE